MHLRDHSAKTYLYETGMLLCYCVILENIAKIHNGVGEVFATGKILLPFSIFINTLKHLFHPR